MPLIELHAITFSPYLAHKTVLQKLEAISRLKDFFTTHAEITTAFPAEVMLSPFAEGLFSLSGNQQLEVGQAIVTGIDRIWIEAMGFQTAPRQDVGFHY